MTQKKFSYLILISFILFLVSQIQAQDGSPTPTSQTTPSPCWNPPLNVPEIPNPQLGDYAEASITPQGPVIYYNPVLMKKAVEAAVFIRAHEYGHIQFQHMQQESFLSHNNGMGQLWLSPKFETQADLYATDVCFKICPNALQKAVDFFKNQSVLSDKYHAPGVMRANNILRRWADLISGDARPFDYQGVQIDVGGTLVLDKLPIEITPENQ